MLFRNLFGGLFALCLAAGATHAQQVGVNTPTPHPSAALEVQSTERGLLPPRLTQAQRDAIATPAEGLTIYNLDTHCMEFWNGTAWISTCATTAPCVPPPASTPAANTPVCAGSTLNLTATPVPGATYVWSGPNAFSSTTQNPSIANVSAANAGVYRLRTWALGCYSDEMTVTVTVCPTLIRPVRPSRVWCGAVTPGLQTEHTFTPAGG